MKNTNVSPHNPGRQRIVVFCVFALAGLWGNTAFCQPTYLKSSNSEAGDFFGISVGISGSTILVGAPGEDSNATEVNGDETDNSASARGAAYVFVRDEVGVWTQQAYLKASDWGGFGQPNIGHRVAVSGETAVVASPFVLFSGGGASGAAYVFVRDGESWSEQEIVVALNGGNGDGFGSSVAISGDTMVVGASFEDSAMTGVDSDPSDNSAEQSGAAYVFVRSGTSWSQQAYLKASNTGAGDFFGESVAISGDTVVVGAPVEDSNLTGVDNAGADNDLAEGSGAAYVFVRNGSSWSQQAYLKASNTGNGDNFGQSVAVDGDTIVVGASREDSDGSGVNGTQDNDNISNTGAAYVFVRDNTGDWSQHSYLKASDAGIFDQFGSAVAISGDMLAVSAEAEDAVITDSGAVYAFSRDGNGDWSELGKAKASYPNLSDRLGMVVGLSGDLLVAGTWFEDSDVQGVNGGDGNNELAKDSGAAYAWEVSELPSNVNIAPIAEDDMYPLITGGEGEPPVLFVPPPGVLGNDTDPDSSPQPLTVTLQQDVAAGVLSLNPDGSFVYTPPQDFAGEVFFTYKANDGQDDSNIARVDISVGADDGVFADGFEG